MKRSASLLVILLILIFVASNSFAQTPNVNLSYSIKGVQHFASGDIEEVLVSIDGYSGYSTMTLAQPDRIVVDFKNASAPGPQQKISVGGSLVQSVRYAQFMDDTARVVLDVTGKYSFKVQEGAGYVRITVSKTGIFPSESTVPVTNPVSRGDYDRGTITVDADFSIDYAAGDNIEKVTINIDSYKGYRNFTLVDPNRIVIDIPEAKAPNKQQSIDVNGEIIKSIRYAKFDSKTARIVIDTNKNVEYDIEEKKGQLVLTIKDPVYEDSGNENITLSMGKLTYYNKGDRVYVTLDGVKLTEGGETLKKFYTEEYKGNKYTLTFSNDIADLSSNTVKINDKYLESIEIRNNKSSGTTSIIFNAKKEFKYFPIYRGDVNNTAINILKPASKSDKLVVIDAGHGGSEPGAIYGNLYEKDLNLDIALKLNELLKSKGVKTYMIRQDDSYVGLYERAYIANNLNAALFLSVHNNAMDDRSYAGTMTLYYSKSSGSGFNGYKFAQIVQRNLLSKLGTIDRSVRERPNLVVLKATAMPSALAEVAFMTNESDRMNLQNEAFRMKAAEALCNAVIESLKQVY